MAILIANLGTSDLAIKLKDFDFYLPIFDRDEPNEKTSHLTEVELDTWSQRNEYAAILCDELDIQYSKSPKNGEPKISFVDFTKKLLDHYLNDSDSWHSRIRPGRIGGTIIEAQNKFHVETIHLFTTNQNPQQKFDTVYLMEILKLWFKKEYNLTLTTQQIPEDTPAIDTDKLLNYYYNFFISNSQNDQPILVSIKGGTFQMQTALKMQAIASSVSKLIFIDPQFDISKTLAGKFSECELTSYWRYMRTQKYQAVKLLLDENHWDFNGATQILQDWTEVLRFFINHQVVNNQDITQSNEAISRIIKTLNVGIDCFNLDIKSAEIFLNENSHLQFSTNLANQVKNYDVVLNLYTQCRIFWKLNQVANFLSRMSSFYEAILNTLAKKLNLYNSQQFKKLQNRYDKRDFIDTEIRGKNQSDLIENWEHVQNSLKSLDFWCQQRNNIIHGAEGVSKDRMQELYRQERHYKPDIAPPNLILDKMVQILNNDLELIPKQYLHKYVGDHQTHYIYSEVKNWVIKTLDSQV